MSKHANNEGLESNKRLRTDYSNLSYTAKGFWTTHFSLPVYLNESQEKFVDDLIKHLAKEDRKVTKLEEFHVTLTKTFQLKHSIAKSLVESAENEFKEKIERLAEDRFFLGELKLLPGKNLKNYYQKELDDGYFDNKTFIAFEIKSSSNQNDESNYFKLVNESLVKCFRANKLSSSLVFTDKSYLYHVSVAWINKNIENLDANDLYDLINQFQIDHNRSLDFNSLELNRLKLKIGNKIHFFSIY